MKYLITFSKEKRDKIINDLHIMDLDLQKQSKKMKFIAKMFNKMNHFPSDLPLFSLTWKEINKKSIEITFLLSMGSMINPEKINNAFFKIAKDLNVEIKIIENNDEGTFFKNKKEKK